MINTQHNMLSINKAPALMGAWGLAILLGAIINQFFELPNPNYTLMLWGLFSLLGIAGHTLCYFRGLGNNFSIWMGLIAVGWLFTLYVFKWDSGRNIGLLADLPAVWLFLLGVGYVITALQIDRRFFYLAAVHFLVGALIELSARKVVQIDFVDEYAPLIFGLTAGLSLVAASLPVFYAPKQVRAPAAPA